MINRLKNDMQAVRTQTFGYISAAFGLVAGLAWNDAVKDLIDELFPVSKDTVIAKFAYAVIITIAVVLLIQYLEKAIKRKESE